MSTLYDLMFSWPEKGCFKFLPDVGNFCQNISRDVRENSSVFLSVLLASLCVRTADFFFFFNLGIFLVRPSGLW